MKRHVCTAIAIIFVYGVLVVGVSAQTGGSPTMRADIPFAFTVGEKSLPAGVYVVSILNPASDRPALRVRSVDGRSSAIVQTVGVGGNRAENSKLVFRRYGDRHFFAQAQMGGNGTSLATAKTRAERAVQRSLKYPAVNTDIAAF